MKDFMNRREAIAAVLASAAVLSMMSACSWEPEHMPANKVEAEVFALSDEVANNLLCLSPESATSLGIDIGARSDLRSQLGDRSAQRQQKIADQLRSDL